MLKREHKSCDKTFFYSSHLLRWSSDALISNESDGRQFENMASFFHAPVKVFFIERFAKAYKILFEYISVRSSKDLPTSKRKNFYF